MNNSDLDKILDNAIQGREKETTLANTKLSAIFREHYQKFRIIQLSYKNGLSDSKKEFSTYTKQIQSILASVGKFQNNGSPISEYQIINEMYKESKRRALTDTPTPSIEDSDSSFKRPTTDFKGESKGKVSANSNKKVLAVKNKEVSAINNGVIEPIRIENMAKATHILKEEIRTYKKDGVIPVWNGNDEFSFIDYKAQAKKHGVEINQLMIKNVLDLRFNQDYVDYYEAWTNKAYLCEKLF